MASGFGQSAIDPYYLSSDTNKYITSKCVAEMTPRGSDPAVRILTATRLYMNSLPESPKILGQGNLNVNDYYSNLMEISSTYLLPDITNWWLQQEELH
jgi:hypothetical protein